MHNIAEVVIYNVNVCGAFYYFIPDHIYKDVKIGSFVQIIFGSKNTYGIVIDIKKYEECKDIKNIAKIKEIMSVYQDIPIIHYNLIKLIKYVSCYYLFSMSKLFKGVVTGNFKKILSKNKIKEGLHNKQNNDISEYTAITLHKLTSDQQKSIKCINNIISNFKQKKTESNVVLLYGVTGSGKTEIYINLIKKTISQKKSVIFLVPEVSLILQIFDILRSFFGSIVSVLHYKLNNTQKTAEWLKIYNQKFVIIVGTRSAIFAPCNNLGLIIIDEEHHSSYKQEQNPIYETKNVAIIRSKIEQCPVIFGSATPSLESYYNAINGIYHLITLNKRILNQFMPLVKVIDMRNAKKHYNIISQDLINAIKVRLHNSEQIILFLNRRGFSTYLMCSSCGYLYLCDNCNVPYTYYKSNNKLMCNICGKVKDHINKIQKCPICNTYNIKYLGVGTEKIEFLIQKLFPLASIGRVDSDVMSNFSLYNSIINKFKYNKINILIGTQMLSSGLNFSNVTLVGVINADSGLFLSDFRSSEKTFQLIMQVAGRSGRGDVYGEVYIQTFIPFNATIQNAINQNYHSFFNDEIIFRKKFLYPPINNLIKIEIYSKSNIICKEISKKLFNNVNELLYISNKKQKNNTKIVLSDVIDKVDGYFIAHIIIRCIYDKICKQEIGNIVYRYNKKKNIKVTIDVEDSINPIKFNNYEIFNNRE